MANGVRAPGPVSPQELLAAAQALAEVGSFRWDVGPDVVSWSDELYRLYGLPAGSPVSRETYLQRIHPDDRAAVGEAIGRCLAERTGYARDYRIVRMTGETRWVQGRVRPVLGDDGTVVALYGTCHDITERKQTEHALSEARSRLEGAATARRQAAEINENIIHWLVQALRALETLDVSAAHEALQQTVQHASRIVTELEGGLPPRRSGA